MAKFILIFSDGTGQIGGLRPDQRLSNVYKLYRAMRPGPDSPIKPTDQIAYYDAGLGKGELPGFALKRLRRLLGSATGHGMDDNIIDCYAAIISFYEPGDQICLFGFSRGAYTVRALANVLNLCGVPTTGRDGGPLPRYGADLRKIATDAVRYIYNHGAGHPRDKYENEREEKARRFRVKYGSDGQGAGGEGQGNVQPTLIGVFDTVAALNSRLTRVAFGSAFCVTLALALCLAWRGQIWWAVLAAIIPVTAAYYYLSLLFGQYKYFLANPDRRLHWWNPLDWRLLYTHGHFASWSEKHYDRYVDREVRFLRHALSIDEARTKFPRVGWGSGKDVQWNNDMGRPDWLKQIWFAGNHSDVGGSYPETECRLSDIALEWMLDEVRHCLPAIHIRPDLLHTHGDPCGLQHDERQRLLDLQPGWLRRLTANRLTWTRTMRPVHQRAALHPTVLDRFAAKAVPQMGRAAAYRPANLENHVDVKQYYETG